MFDESVYEAFNALGVQPDLITLWLRECCCNERIQRLTALQRWADRIAAGKVEGAAQYLLKLIGSEA